jgi:hypothetical protein
MDLFLPKIEYDYFHDGLKLLSMKTDAQLAKAKSLGIEAVELSGKNSLIKGMINFVEDNFYKTGVPMVTLFGVSNESLGILMAGALESIKHLTKQKALSNEKAIKEGIDKKIERINKNLNLKYFKNIEPDSLLSEDNRNGKPIVFISYAGDELALADFLRDLLNRWSDGKVEPFVARRDIGSGEDPLQVMLRDKLLNAKAVIPICSIKSKQSSWVWWESATVWSKGYKIYPLFTNIYPDAFGPPLTLVSQGKFYFDENEFLGTIKTLCTDLNIQINTQSLSQNELAELKKLKNEYEKPETSAKVEVGYTKMQITALFHKYSFTLDIENKTKKKFDDVVVELLFPVDYLERKIFSYPFLSASASEEDPKYQNLVFTYSALNEDSRRRFGSGLLPEKKLRVFGEKNGLFNLVYEMDHSRWDERFKYNIQWKVYIDGGAPLEGMVPLNEIQCF